MQEKEREHLPFYIRQKWFRHLHRRRRYLNRQGGQKQRSLRSVRFHSWQSLPSVGQIALYAALVAVGPQTGREDGAHSVEDGGDAKR